MIAGRLTERITLCPLVGGTWQTGATVSAERVRFSGRGVEQLGETFAAESVRWRIRDVHRVAELWRIRDERSGHVYTVVGIERNAARQFVELICERVNL